MRPSFLTQLQEFLIYVLIKIFDKENEKHQKTQKDKIKDIMKKKREDEKKASENVGQQNDADIEEDLW